MAQNQYTENDLVSIITPSYNTALFIAETIESVLKQSYTNWEMLIVDDNSTDNTEQIVSGFSDSRIHYLKNPQNSGAAISRNRALKIAKGRWIAFLDSDDLWYPEKLEHQISFMQKNDYHFSCTKRSVIDQNSVPTGKIISSPKKVGRIGMYCYCWPGCLTVMYDADYVGEIQISDLKKNNDYAMWLKVVKKAECYYLDEELSRYRERVGSISHDSFKKLVKSHYELFKIGDDRGTVCAILLTGLNLFFGVIKKVFYVHRI